MIHGAKLLNKKKIRKVLCAKKNKKNQKKIIYKIEKRQRSGKPLKRGVVYHLPKHRKNGLQYTHGTDVSYLYCGGL